MQAKTVDALLWQAIDAYHNGCGAKVDVTVHIHDNAAAIDAVEFAHNVHPERWAWKAVPDVPHSYVVVQYNPGYPAITVFLPMDAVVRWMEECGRCSSPQLNEQDEFAARPDTP